MRKRRAALVVVPPDMLELAEHVYAVDRVLHDPLRLALLVLLQCSEAKSFRELQEQMGMTSGNLGSQMGKLEHAGYVEVLKAFEERKPITRYRVTAAGRAALDTYWSHMQWFRQHTTVRLETQDGTGTVS